jgi:hypothetical protein
MAKANALLPDELRNFLEKQPLYATFRVELEKALPPNWEFHGRTWPTSLSFACDRCSRETTWMREDESPRVLTTDTALLVFKCARCSGAMIAFWVVYEGDVVEYVVRKIGQLPAWSIEVPTAIKAALPVGQAVRGVQRGGPRPQRR